jgi:drug/metabolite transporter (DMT)-like permease
MWACNALIGRLLADSMPPLLLNALRWWVALLVLLPLGWGALSTPRTARPDPPALAPAGLAGPAGRRGLQRAAVPGAADQHADQRHADRVEHAAVDAADRPLFHGERIRPQQALGALLSIAGVLTVLVRGNVASLSAIRLVPGDLWMLLAALSWAIYSWMLARPAPQLAGTQRPTWTWAEFLLVQALFGLVWASAAAGGEWV